MVGLRDCLFNSSQLHRYVTTCTCTYNVGCITAPIFYPSRTIQYIARKCNESRQSQISSMDEVIYPQIIFFCSWILFCRWYLTSLTIVVVGNRIKNCIRSRVLSFNIIIIHPVRLSVVIVSLNKLVYKVRQNLLLNIKSRNADKNRVSGYLVLKEPSVRRSYHTPRPCRGCARVYPTPCI